jgi:hypothetical protein
MKRLAQVSVAAMSLAAIFLSPVEAAPRTINDCETIEAADAYNQCLASFGPIAHIKSLSNQDEGHGTVTATADESPNPSRGQRHVASQHTHQRHYAASHHASRHYAHFSRHHHARMEFRITRKSS